MTNLRRLFYPVCSTRLGHRAARLAIRSLRSVGLSRNFHLPFDALDLDHDAVAGLTQLWSRIHWSAGDGMMPADQLLAIYKLAITWPARGDIVELGSWTGLTTCYLATAARVRRSGNVYAVDTFAGTKEGNTNYDSITRFGGSTRDAFDQRVRQAELADRITPLVGLTTDVATRYPGNPIRLLLIDADHSYEGVRKDFESWLPHMAPGGLIIFHDYLISDVSRFIDDHIATDARVTIDPGLVVPNVFAVTNRVRTTLAAVTQPLVLPLTIRRSAPEEEARRVGVRVSGSSRDIPNPSNNPSPTHSDQPLTEVSS